MIVSGGCCAALLMLCACHGSDPLSRACRPALFAPAAGEVLDNGCSDRSDPVIWSFDWGDCPGAGRYHLFVMHSGSPLPVIDLSALAQTSWIERQDNSFVPDPNRLDWRWRVRAMINGRWGEWSEERTFDVEPQDTDCP